MDLNPGLQRYGTVIGRTEMPVWAMNCITSVGTPVALAALAQCRRTADSDDID
jgi:hypothetical protein